MSLDATIDKEQPHPSVIQNRLNVAGFAITALLFSASFSFSLFGTFRAQGDAQGSGDFRTEFVHIEVALAVGLALCLLAVACLLLAQQKKFAVPAGATKFPRLRKLREEWPSQEWWFSVGQVLLFVALSQALSASLTEVVYGVSLGSRALGYAIGYATVPIWLLLLIGAPSMFILKMQFTTAATGAHSRAALLAKRALMLIFVVVVVGVLAANAGAYTAIECKRDYCGVSKYLGEFFKQLVQPALWPEPWK